MKWTSPVLNSDNSSCLSSLTSRLNGYMYSNGTSLNMALFVLMANHFYSRITLQLLGVDIIPCRVASLIDMQLKQKDWCQSTVCPTRRYIVFILL